MSATTTMLALPMVRVMVRCHWVQKRREGRGAAHFLPSAGAGPMDWMEAGLHGVTASVAAKTFKGRTRKAANASVVGNGRAPQPDGRKCIFCHCTDDSQDHVTASTPMKWGMPPRDGKNDGRVCYYCRRVWRAKWKSRHTLDAFAGVIGQDESIHSEFVQLQKFAIQKMKDAGNHDVRITAKEFGAEESVLTLHNKRKVEVAQDPDEVVPIADYKAEYGNPATNGTGHKCIQWQGELCVVIPAKRRWKVHRSQVMEAALSQTTDNGDFVLTANQLEEQLEIMGDSLLPFEATGMSLDALVGHKQSSSASNCDGPHGGGGLAASLGASASFGIGGFKFHEVSKVTDASAPVARRKSGGGAPSPSPKENTKAAAKAAKATPPKERNTKGGNVGEGSTRKGGRPKRDVTSHVQETIEAFTNAKQDCPKHFGNASKVHRRWCERLLKDCRASLHQSWKYKWQR